MEGYGCKSCDRNVKNRSVRQILSPMTSGTVRYSNGQNLPFEKRLAFHQERLWECLVKSPRSRKSPAGRSSVSRPNSSMLVGVMDSGPTRRAGRARTLEWKRRRTCCFLAVDGLDEG